MSAISSTSAAMDTVFFWASLIMSICAVIVSGVLVQLSGPPLDLATIGMVGSALVSAQSINSGNF